MTVFNQEARLLTKEDFKYADSEGYLPAWGEPRPWGDAAIETAGWTTIRLSNLSSYYWKYWTNRPSMQQREESWK